jgi:ribosomal protein S18 acetylase RimI-like enzyme
MKKQIAKILESINLEFEGILIQKPIEEYVIKIISNSTIIPFISEGILKGFISFYCNDFKGKKGYLSMVIVSKDSRDKGIGKILLEASIEYLKNLEFETYSLEVHKTNNKAIDFYSSFGFIKKENKGNFWLMELIL